MTWTGGCLCGAVRYQAEADPFRVAHCHCEFCRKVSGAAFLTFVAFKTEDFIWTAGEPARYRSSPGAERAYCPRCGSTLGTFEDDLPDWTQVSLGSLDRPQDVKPIDHIFVDSQLGWLHMDDGLPKYSRFSPDGGIEDE